MRLYPLSVAFIGANSVGCKPHSGRYPFGAVRPTPGTALSGAGRGPSRRPWAIRSHSELADDHAPVSANPAVRARTLRSVKTSEWVPRIQWALSHRRQVQATVKKARLEAHPLLSTASCGLVEGRFGGKERLRRRLSLRRASFRCLPLQCLQSLARLCRPGQEDGS